MNFPDMPASIGRLPKDERGYPVPWFVAWVDGVPDFRVIGPGKFAQAIMDKHCWVCGEKLGRFLSFVIGPMCAINRTTSEPPCHHKCAEFSAKYCPFLTKPQMKRNQRSAKPEGTMEPAGTHIDRNPGVCLLWTTKRYKTFKADQGILIDIGDPLSVEWWAQGRQATREEVMHSIDTGLPILRDMADEEGDESVKELLKRYDQTVTLVDLTL